MAPRPCRVASGALSCAALVLAAGTAGGGASSAPASAPRHSVVLITLDTTRADHLGSYGWSPARTPNLDALARRGARFARCDTSAPITLPSHATLLTGLYPPRHGVRDNGTYSLSARIDTVTVQLRAAGYDTAAVVSALVLARRHGLDRGFRIYDDDLGTSDATSTQVQERQAEATTAAALAALSQLRPPFFLWVHYFDPHEEYRPPARFADSVGGPHHLYDGEIAYMDEQIGALLRRLPADAGTVVVADHGEMLGEHGELTHGLLPFAGARRVPLLVAGPEVPAGRVVPCLVRTADVAPTLLRFAALDPPKGLDGVSLLPLPAGSECDRPSYYESFLPFFSYKWYPLRAMSDGRQVYVHGPRPSLYSLAGGDAEERDLAPSEPAVTARWQERLRALLAGMGEGLEPELRPSEALSPEVSERLASLGYLGGGGGGRVGPELPDPRSMTAVAQQLHHAAKQVQQDHCAEALPALEEIVRRDPHNVSAMNLAGKCQRDAGRHEAALALFRRAEQERPLSALPVTSVAGTLLVLGRKDEAMAAYRRALSLDPTQPEAASNLARLLRERRDTPAALRVLDDAISAGCHVPSVYLERGLALAESGRVPEALASFREAALRSPTDPMPLENAARAAYQLGRHRESAQLYESLLRLTPARGDLWKTLGALRALQLGDKPGAVRAFREALRLEADPGERTRIEALIRELGG